MHLLFKYLIIKIFVVFYKQFTISIRILLIRKLMFCFSIIIFLIKRRKNNFEIINFSFFCHCLIDRKIAKLNFAQRC